MGSTHSALFCHVIFGTKLREPLLGPDWQDRLYAYIGGIVRNAGGVLMIAGGTRDHIHLLLSLKPAIAISDLVRDIKRDSSKWIHDTQGLPEFAWQDGYGIFSVSASAIDEVTHYIRNQQAHHRKATFEEEYVRFLDRHQIPYDPRFL